MDYSDFLQCHKELNDNESNKQWDGRLYLPPCSCYTSINCPNSSISTPYDFENFSDVQVPSLINLCQYIDTKSESFTDKSIILCKNI